MRRLQMVLQLVLFVALVVDATPLGALNPPQGPPDSPKESVKDEVVSEKIKPSSLLSVSETAAPTEKNSKSTKGTPSPTAKAGKTTPGATCASQKGCAGCVELLYCGWEDDKGVCEERTTESRARLVTVCSAPQRSQQLAVQGMDAELIDPPTHQPKTPTPIPYDTADKSVYTEKATVVDSCAFPPCSPVMMVGQGSCGCPVCPCPSPYVSMAGPSGPMARAAATSFGPTGGYRAYQPAMTGLSGPPGVSLAGPAYSSHPPGCGCAGCPPCGCASPPCGCAPPCLETPIIELDDPTPQAMMMPKVVVDGRLSPLYSTGGGSPYPGHPDHPSNSYSHHQYHDHHRNHYDHDHDDEDREDDRRGRRDRRGGGSKPDEREQALSTLSDLETVVKRLKSKVSSMGEPNEQGQQQQEHHHY